MSKSTLWGLIIACKWNFLVHYCTNVQNLILNLLRIHQSWIWRWVLRVISVYVHFSDHIYIELLWKQYSSETMLDAGTEPQSVVREATMVATEPPQQIFFFYYLKKIFFVAQDKNQLVLFRILKHLPVISKKLTRITNLVHSQLCAW